MKPNMCLLSSLGLWKKVGGGSPTFESIGDMSTPIPPVETHGYIMKKHVQYGHMMESEELPSPTNLSQIMFTNITCTLNVRYESDMRKINFSIFTIFSLFSEQQFSGQLRNSSRECDNYSVMTSSFIQ